MKYTLKNNKNELLFAANESHERQQVLIYLLLTAITIGVLF